MPKSHQAAVILRRARNLSRTLGVRTAAGYLRNQGFEFADAHRALLGCEPRFS